MKRAALGALLVLWSGQLCAQSPEDSYRLGVEARRAGDFAAARDRLSSVVAAEPGNADARVELGLTLLALNRLDEAETQFRETLAIAPAYADARIGLARIAQRRGQRAAALAELDRVPGPNPDADALRAQLLSSDDEERAPRWSLDLDGSYSALDSNRPDWWEGIVALRYQATPATAVAGGIEVARRFRRTDTYGEVRVEHRVSDALSGYVLLGGTPEADFRPRWQIGIGGAWRVRSGGAATVLRLDARHADYAAGAVQTLTPGVEQYLLGGRMWITAQWINIFDDQSDRHRAGWLGRVDLYAAPRVRLFGGYADAPDLSEGIVVGVKSAFGGIVWEVSDRNVIRLSLAHEDRATGADRTTFALGLGYRF